MEILSNIWDILSGICVTLVVIFWKGIWKMISEFSVLQNEIKHLREKHEEIKTEVQSIKRDFYSPTTIRTETK